MVNMEEEETEIFEECFGLTYDKEDSKLFKTCTKRNPPADAEQYFSAQICAIAR